MDRARRSVGACSSGSKDERSTMGRYTGPVCRLCRREGEKLFLKGDRCHTPKCAIERRGDRGPGMPSLSRRRPTEYATHLREKQKARRTYGVLERQFVRHFRDAMRGAGARGERLLQSLELRMDSIVFRMGFALSRAQARQLITHGHFELNARKHDIASAVLRPGDQGLGATEESRPGLHQERDRSCGGHGPSGMAHGRARGILWKGREGSGAGGDRRDHQ